MKNSRMTNATAVMRSLRQFPFSDPIGVERARLIEPLIRVGTEVIALSLKQVGRQALAPIAIVVGEDSRKRRDGDSELCCRGHDMTPRVLDFRKCFGEVRGEQQVLELRIRVERFLYPIEKHGPNDTAATPQHGTIAIIERPFVFSCCRL